MGWSVFDWPYEIRLIDVSAKGTRDQNTGEWIPAVDATRVIVGNLELSPLGDDTRGRNGLIAEGDAVLYTEEKLIIGDLVETDHDSGGTVVRKWRVKAIEEEYHFIHAPDSTNRPGYILAMEADA